jgi:hypothetical protein
MTDIIAFISARLDDDEAYALEAAKEFGPDWIEIWSGEIDLSANLPDRQPPAGRHWDAHVQTNDSRVSRHMVRHDPARVLAEVKAKRAIVARHSTGIVYGSWPTYGGEREELWRFCELLHDECELPLLAAIYADHPEYDPAWRVE